MFGGSATRWPPDVSRSQTAISAIWAGGIIHQPQDIRAIAAISSGGARALEEAGHANARYSGARRGGECAVALHGAGECAHAIAGDHDLTGDCRQSDRWH